MDKKLYTLPPLPYTYDALDPYISKEIMELHHAKHHATYVNNLNKALENHDNLLLKSAEALLVDLSQVPEDIRTTVKNNGGGHVNHSMFWQIMAPKAGGEPSGKLAEGIEKQFGSFEEFKTKFNDEGAKRFGSGWVWLVLASGGELKILSTPNQDNPLTEGHWPIIGNDVWEHAYYLQYKNVRADYLKAWWSVVNWPEIEKRFNNANLAS